MQVSRERRGRVHRARRVSGRGARARRRARLGGAHGSLGSHREQLASHGHAARSPRRHEDAPCSARTPRSRPSSRRATAAWKAAARLYRALFLSMDAQLDQAETRDARRDRCSSASPRRFAPMRSPSSGESASPARTPERAEPSAREAMDVLDALGGVEEGESYVRLTFAEALDANGDHDAAREAIATARVRILERAAMIHDPRVEGELPRARAGERAHARAGAAVARVLMRHRRAQDRRAL